VNEKIGFNDYFYKQSHILSNIASTINLTIYIYQLFNQFGPALCREKSELSSLPSLLRKGDPPAYW
jgi:hypothetical protein